MIAEITFSFRNINGEHLVIFLVGYSVVFFSLAFLWMVFYNVPRVLRIARKMREKKQLLTAAPKPTQESVNGSMTGEEAAAISMALFLYISELHDEENRVLTIRKISRRYSPWSSKIYSVTNGLNKRF
jgi:glutaconyl-CoA/methylmalonyl-CoA decarboxylase subunit delta